ncbi:MAG: DUF5060 domain-containing protein [Phycisphaerae bacterium]|nr:DUF5060 domain-containing protein [Phycisphaerae bacterium]
MTRIAATRTACPAVLALLAAALLCISAATAAEGGRLIVPAEFGDNTATLWLPTLEWTLKNPSHDGNPFDLVAKATFTHVSGKETRVTEMFYAGEDTWKFRFTGTRTGKWTFITQADGADGTTNDPELHGREGGIDVAKHPDASMRGFITHRGNKFARQVLSPDDLEGFVPATYMNQRKFGNPEGKGWTDITPTATDPDTREAYFDEVEAHGCNGVFFHVIHQWLRAHALGHDDHDRVNPDLETFAALDTLIIAAHQRGLYVHLWAWGDSGRKWTPDGLPGGINGEVDRRVQRYIAARLAPLPGWVMGYGFDLREWTREEDLQSWAEYLHARMGWRHMLWGRDRFNEELDAKSYAGYGVRTYDEIVEKLESDSDRPHLFEERDAYLRNDSLSQTGTRRFMWRQAIAGGAMGFWGHYPKGYLDKGDYPHPEQFVCLRTFWDGRFLLDMQRAGDLTDGFALATPDQEHLVFYKEDTEKITMDLSDMDGPQPAVAVDTTKAYREIDIGPLKPGEHTWKAPHKSDWAIAVGEFPDRTKP